MRSSRSALRTTAAAAACVAAVVGCGQSSPRAQSAPSNAASPTSSTTDALYDIGGGRQLHMTCSGAGSPTILLEAGGGDDSNTWRPSIVGPLEAQTQVCRYDRAGTGSSDPAPNRRRMMRDVVSDLTALLAAAHIDDRLLLVGTSFGGQVALDWAVHHPTRTAGLVILDTDWPSGDPKRTPDRALSAAERADIKKGDAWDAPGNREHVAYQETLPETEAAVHPLPGIPIRILTANQDPECEPGNAACARYLAGAIELQAQWLTLSPTATRRIVDAGHVLHHDVPEVVLETIQSALQEARG